MFLMNFISVAEGGWLFLLQYSSLTQALDFP